MDARNNVWGLDYEDDLDFKDDFDEPFRFLDLCAELRGMVYQYAILSATETCTRLVHKHDYMTSRRRRHLRPVGCLALTQTCRLVRGEFHLLYVSARKTAILPSDLIQYVEAVRPRFSSYFPSNSSHYSLYHSLHYNFFYKITEGTGSAWEIGEGAGEKKKPCIYLSLSLRTKDLDAPLFGNHTDHLPMIRFCMRNPQVEYKLGPWRHVGMYCGNHYTVDPQPQVAEDMEKMLNYGGEEWKDWQDMVLGSAVAARFEHEKELETAFTLKLKTTRLVILVDKFYFQTWQKKWMKKDARPPRTEALEITIVPGKWTE
ncbi:hypothetical protein EJ04DRAFT_561641 [Polyplosphaeria fusca]|uniref:Uncharacterized protein n=1 Tax=Polyplosphaeria fusca TaxID=682080 RepID=A0A9P4V2J8_9PLEO|nr:hypothetical protein EJ04DRAFT_561641 [Polyplosphaeria fusca]